jgi:isoaspartyl peptidase/L-asparaginase-like protein (Ntn-hydrolase superfamily)
LTWLLAVHGGAGEIPAQAEAPAWASRARGGLEEALRAGASVLRAGGPALLAVVEAVAALEDCPAFNAGHGSVANAEGGVEMDAAVMEGAGRRAGAVAAVRALANPVRAALAVLERSPHVLLAGEGAESFARAQGLAAADPARLTATARRLAEDWERRQRAAAEGPRGARGTVGAVARDGRGHLAAATSTGGTPRKLPGRLSDSCLPGAGTWADDATCAVSATGWGELFIRCAFAHEVDALVRHAGLGLEAACARALRAVAELGAPGGSGGCIALDRHGALVLPFDTRGMPRGWISTDGTPHLALHPGESLELPRL